MPNPSSSNGGQLSVKVDNDACTGEVYLHGATVTAWQPKGAEPVLWLSSQSAFDGAAPIRGGVPICFPWFGPGRDGDKAPAHGWARISEWAFEGSRDLDGATELTFTLSRDGVDLTYVVTMGEALELVLTAHASGSDAVDIEQALHTYLTVCDSRQISLSGLDGVEYVDKVDGATTKTQDGDITITGETDRVYLKGSDVTVDDPALNRRLVVWSQGARNTVVWNPWVDKSAAMPDFGDDEWTGMVCVEAANALGDAFSLKPGGSATLAQRITVAPR